MMPPSDHPPPRPLPLSAATDVLVTGAQGFIGRALGAGLTAAAIPWIGVSRRDGIDLEQVDATARLPLCRQIVHLAGRSGVPESWAEPALYFRTNFLTTLTALEHARHCGAAFVLMSTYMYGVPQRQPIDESHPVACRNPYAHSKWQCEQLAVAYARDFGVPVTILRPFNLFGRGQDPRQLIAHIVTQARTGSEIRVADLTPRRDYLWMDDLIDAVLKVVTAPPPAGREPAIYNLGAGISHSVADVIAATLALTGPRTVISAETERMNEIPDCVCDAGRFQRTFDWRPRTDLTGGLRMLLES